MCGIMDEYHDPRQVAWGDDSPAAEQNVHIIGTKAINPAEENLRVKSQEPQSFTKHFTTGQELYLQFYTDYIKLIHFIFRVTGLSES